MVETMCRVTTEDSVWRDLIGLFCRGRFRVVPFQELLRVVIIARLLKFLDLLLQSGLQHLLLLTLALNLTSIPPSNTASHSIYPSPYQRNKTRNDAHSRKQGHDSDFRSPDKKSLTVESIVLSQGIVDDVCEVYEDGVESNLPCNGTLSVTQR